MANGAVFKFVYTEESGGQSSSGSAPSPHPVPGQAAQARADVQKLASRRQQGGGVETVARGRLSPIQPPPPPGNIPRGKIAPPPIVGRIRHIMAPVQVVARAAEGAESGVGTAVTSGAAAAG